MLNRRPASPPAGARANHTWRPEPSLPRPTLQFRLRAWRVFQRALDPLAPPKPLRPPAPQQPRAACSASLRRSSRAEPLQGLLTAEQLEALEEPRRDLGARDGEADRLERL